MLTVKEDEITVLTENSAAKDVRIRELRGELVEREGEVDALRAACVWSGPPSSFPLPPRIFRLSFCLIKITAQSQFLLRVPPFTTF